jgi:uncharacterized protein
MSPRKLVLDTNVVIDWLVFDDPFLARFRSQVLEGHITIVTHAPALEELRRVLAYPELKLDGARRDEVLERYVAQTVLFTTQGSPSTATNPGDLATPLPRGFPRCRDSDDDPFLALAWYAKADALVSRDNEVLKLARRCRKFGFEVMNVPQMVAVLS